MPLIWICWYCFEGSQWRSPLWPNPPPSLPQIASITNLFLVIEVYIPIKIRSVDLSGISVIEMSVRPTLGIMSIVHNINGARLLTPLGVSTIETVVTKVTMVIEWLEDLLVAGLVWLCCCRGQCSFFFVGWPPSHKTSHAVVYCSITCLVVRVRSLMALSSTVLWCGWLGRKVVSYIHQP